MKFTVTAIFLVALFNGAFTKPSGVILGYQDNLGQYSFGYSAPDQARAEVRSIDGVTRGSYSYVDPAGLIQSTDYTADGQHGFRVSATNLPQAPAAVQETSEVAAARAAHLVTLQEALEDAKQSAESDSVTILSKSAEPETSEKDQDASPSAKPEEPTIQAAEKPEKELPSLAAATAEADAAEKKDADLKKEEEKEEKKEKKEKETEEGKAIEEPAAAVAPVIVSPAAFLPIPSIPINFDLPTIPAYSSRTTGAKADLTTLPQSTLAQGGITPASTTLKTLPGSPQQVVIFPQIHLTGGQLTNVPASTTADSEKDKAQYETARAVFAPIGSVNVLGFDPAASSFFRYAPFPHVAYNIL